MRHPLSFTLVSAAVFMLAAPTFGATVAVGGSNYNVEFVATAGTITDPSTANTALLALDFDPAHVYLFGYQWQTGTKTGYDLIADVAAASGGTLTYDVSFFGPLAFVGGIDYAGFQTTDNFDPANYSSWAYYLSDNGAAFTSPEAFGASERTLLNGSVDIWTLLTVSPTPPLFEPTRAPAALPTAGDAPTPTPIPLPATFSFFGLAMGGLMVRRKRAAV
jgi:hypothetical protein